MLMSMGLIRKVVLFSFVTSLSLCVAKVGFAATPTGTPCTCSGSKYVILDTNGNGIPEPPPEDPKDWPPGYDEGDPQASGYDAYWTMEQNGNEVYVKGHGMFPNPYFGWEEDYFSYDKSTGLNTITLTEQDRSNPPYNIVVTASRINGAQGFNMVEFFWKSVMMLWATATMVDSNGDGIYDSAVGQSDSLWAPPVLFDNPIEFYTDPNTDKNYWVIPSVMVRISKTSGPWYGPRTGGFKVFVPVGSNALEFKCGDDIWGAVTLSATAIPSPTVTAINPNTDAANGGTHVEITGTNFVNGSGVTIGSKAAVDVTVVSATKITAKTPAHDPGTVDVTVRNPDGQTGTLTNGFTYTEKIIGPLIKANGSTDTVVVSSSDTVSVTVQLDPGPYAGTQADWWIVALATINNQNFWLYMDQAGQWKSFDGNLANCNPVYVGGLFNLPVVGVLNLPLPVGAYMFWFAVDSPIDGVLDVNDGIFLYDWVNVIVQ